MLHRSSDGHDVWDFVLIELRYRSSTPAAPGRHPIPRDRAPVPRLTHTAALAILGKIIRGETVFEIWPPEGGK